MSRVGSVRANNTEDPLSRDSISLGFILGNGLLGDVLEAAEILRSAGVDYGYSGNDTPRGIQAVERQEMGWLKLFDALKEIEKVCGEANEQS